MSAPVAQPIAGRVVARYGRHFEVAALAPDGHALAGAPLEAIARGRRQDIVVGDAVDCSLERQTLVIESVQPRRNLFYRADAMRTKPLAANVDQVAIVFAAQPAPRPEFLWRALLAARVADIGALAICNKADLPQPPTVARMMRDAQELGARCLTTSTVTDPGGARALLQSHCGGQVTLFVGPSGAGKSSLLRLLSGKDLRTGELTRRGALGRQTTTATRWLSLSGGGAAIDSPGFHEFGLAHLQPGQLLGGLPDLAAALAGGASCRFANCRHLEEPGCALRAAVADGRVRPERYAFYRDLMREAAGAPG